MCCLYINIKELIKISERELEQKVEEKREESFHLNFHRVLQKNNPKEKHKSSLCKNALNCARTHLMNNRRNKLVCSFFLISFFLKHQFTDTKLN